MNNQRIRGALPVLAGVIAAVLLGCGGGGGDATPPPAAPPPSLGGGTGGTGAQAPVVSSGTMAKGSIILNGIRYDDSATSVTDDRNRTATQLANGMAIKLRGRSDDNVTGQADRVDVENELRASIQSISTAGNTQSFVAAGLVVIVDSQTIYSNVAGFSSLTVGQRVEVHGPRDTGGNVRATRVEAVGAADGQDELRGTVSNVVTATRQFTLNGNVTVNYSGATFSPAGASATSLVAGALVEIHGSLAGAVFTATQIDLEDTEDEAFRGRDNEKTEFEGYVSGFTAHPGSFTVNGRSVQTTASTRFVGGTAADLANNVKVEAEGTSSSGTLVASKIGRRAGTDRSCNRADPHRNAQCKREFHFARRSGPAERVCRGPRLYRWRRDRRRRNEGAEWLRQGAGTGARCREERHGLYFDFPLEPERLPGQCVSVPQRRGTGDVARRVLCGHRAGECQQHRDLGESQGQQPLRRGRSRNRKLGPMRPAIARTAHVRSSLCHRSLPLPAGVAWMSRPGKRHMNPARQGRSRPRASTAIRCR
jgi:Domain of unknown function (DUF5666)